MLIVLNGAQKGGSTWLSMLTEVLVKPHKIPLKYQQAGFRSSAIDLDKLDLFLRKVDFRRANFYCKQHWYDRPNIKALAARPDTRFANIIRDIRDVLVSRYHHDLRLGNVPPGTSFTDFYFLLGHERMDHYARYQYYWHRDMDEPAAEPLLLSFEGLKSNFESEVRRFGRFLDLEDDEIDVQAAHERTNIRDKIKPGSHFRKGEVGDWVNHMTPEVSEAFRRQLDEIGYGEFLQQLSRRGIVIPQDLITGDW